MTPNDTDEPSEPPGSGGDNDPDRRRIVDFEQESFSRFLDELDRLHSGQTLPDVVGEASFDSMRPLAAKALCSTRRSAKHCGCWLRN
ncbi:MAG: hypothetical protein R3B90_03320 [Planctomycetaceae bacterium]